MKLFAIAILIFSAPAFAQRGGDSQSSQISETQTRRSSERFNIIDWIRKNNETRAAQDAKYGRGGGGGAGKGPYPDFVLTYRTNPVTLTRDGTKVGTYSEPAGRFQFLLDDLFTHGDRFRTINSDLGVEITYSQAKDFTVDPAFTQAKYEYREMGAALLIRPFGRSSQDTGLTFKGGYTNIDETGMFADTIVPVNIFSPFAAVELKLYLVPFLGLKAEYQYNFQTDTAALAGKWGGSRALYGAFLEVYLLNLEAYIFSRDTTLTLGGVDVKETASGTGFGASLFF